MYKHLFITVEKVSAGSSREWSWHDLKKVLNSVARDLWVVLLDLVAVNASYYLALLVRFYVNSQFRPTVAYYLTDWARFTPWYSIAAVLIFMLFRLYGGMWRYAGINDMNRIILANACTTVVHVVGTLVFIRRMPITYYGIGAILQFLMVVVIRFSYRMLLVEKKKMAKTETVPALVVGSGDLGKKVIRHLEDNTPYRAAVIIGPDAGRTMDGIPVLSMKDLDSAVSRVRAVFIADKDLKNEDREKIASAAGDREIKDFTAELTNLSGVIPVTSLLSLCEGSVTLVIDGQETEYASGREALNQLRDSYEVRSIQNGRIELKKASNTWMQDYKAQTGEDVSFF